MASAAEAYCRTSGLNLAQAQADPYGVYPYLLIITRNIGSYATTSITGLENVVLNGVNHGGDSVTQQAKTDLATAFSESVGRAPTATFRSLVPLLKQQNQGPICVSRIALPHLIDESASRTWALPTDHWDLPTTPRGLRNRGNLVGCALDSITCSFDISPCSADGVTTARAEQGNECGRQEQQGISVVGCLHIVIFWV